MRRRNRLAGFTLTEMTIAVTLFGLVIGAPAALFVSTSRAYRVQSSQSELAARSTAILDKIGERVRLTSAAGIVPGGIAAPANTSTIDFQRGVGFLNGAIVWGPPERIAFQYTAADPDDGVDNDGDGLIDEGRVVHIENPGLPGQRVRVLGEWVREALEGEIPGNAVDDNGNGLVDEAGLSFDVDKDRINVWLTIERPGPDGNNVIETTRRTFAFRNRTP